MKMDLDEELRDARDRDPLLDGIMRRVERAGGDREEALCAGVLALADASRRQQRAWAEAQDAANQRERQMKSLLSAIRTESGRDVMTHVVNLFAPAAMPTVTEKILNATREPSA